MRHLIAQNGQVVGQPGYGRYIEGRPQAWASIVPGLSPGLALRSAQPVVARAT